MLNEDIMEKDYPGTTFSEATIARTGKTYASDVMTMAEGLDPETGKATTLFTPEHFEELIRFEEFLYSIRAT